MYVMTADTNPRGGWGRNCSKTTPDHQSVHGMQPVCRGRIQDHKDRAPTTLRRMMSLIHTLSSEQRNHRLRPSPITSNHEHDARTSARCKSNVIKTFWLRRNHKILRCKFNVTNIYGLNPTNSSRLDKTSTVKQNYWQEHAFSLLYRFLMQFLKETTIWISNVRTCTSTATVCKSPTKLKL